MEKGKRQRDRERGKVALSSQPKAHFAKATDSRKPRNPAPHPHVQSLRSQRAHGIGTYHIAPHYIFLARRAQPALIVTADGAPIAASLFPRPFRLPVQELHSSALYRLYLLATETPYQSPLEHLNHVSLSAMARCLAMRSIQYRFVSA